MDPEEEAHYARCRWSARPVVAGLERLFDLFDQREGHRKGRVERERPGRERPHRAHRQQRQRQRGAQQYQRQDHGGALRTVHEGAVKLLVNLEDFLDTGLFLDHRPLRLRIAQEVRGKWFLNLFCYTASATVHACGGGAAGTTSVDMSTTYLDWARKNMAPPVTPKTSIGQRCPVPSTRPKPRSQAWPAQFSTIPVLFTRVLWV